MAIEPNSAAPRAEAPPTTRPARAPYASQIAPRSGPPIGVLPRKTIAWSASTRPRMAGSARTCTIAVDAVMKAMLVQPTAIPIGKAMPRVGDAASTSIATPKPADAMITLCTSMLRRRAV